MKKFMPAAVFIAVTTTHLLYLLVVSDPGCGPPQTLVGYFENGDVFLGFSYAFGAAYSAWSFMLLIACRSTSSAAGAAGGTILTAGLATAGCFLAGCCGSPMLAVYIGIFGISTVTIPKWTIALLTVTICGIFICWQKSASSRCKC